MIRWGSNWVSGTNFDWQTPFFSFRSAVGPGYSAIMKTPLQPVDDTARELARDILSNARFGALAVIDPQSKGPFVTRVAVALDPSGLPVSLVSDLAHHTQALHRNPVCSLLIGEPGIKGDPLTHPRLTITARAWFVRHGDAAHKALSDHYLNQRPKAGLYAGFADFSFLCYQVQGAFLNGGFGRAYQLSPEDLTQ